MLAWVFGAALFCAACGALGSIAPPSATLQSFLFLAMALAATVLLGAFDAYETCERLEEGGAEES